MLRSLFRVGIASVLALTMLVVSVLLVAGGSLGLAVAAFDQRPDWMRSHRPSQSAELTELEERGPALLAAAGLAGVVLGADAIAHRDDEGYEPPVGGVVLGSLATVGIGEYAVEHRDELIIPAVLLGIVAIAALVLDLEPDDAPADPTASP
ncbi:MAG: hypothetical protein J0L92_25645 [Deltaproteobacteria bacterium]|nr:hypothetical protein [Deltaproteobacteria bacterium]